MSIFVFYLSITVLHFVSEIFSQTNADFTTVENDLSDFVEDDEYEDRTFSYPTPDPILYEHLDDSDRLFMRTYDCMQHGGVNYVNMYNVAQLQNETMSNRLKKLPVEFLRFFKCMAEVYGLIDNNTNHLIPEKLPDFHVIPRNTSEHLIIPTIRCLQNISQKRFERCEDVLPVLACIEHISKGNYKSFYFHSFPVPDYYYDDDPDIVRINRHGDIVNSTKYRPEFNE